MVHAPPQLARGWESLSPLADPARRAPSGLACASDPRARPAADADYTQPQSVGDPRPSHSVLRWARGVRQPADAASEALFEPPGRGSMGQLEHRARARFSWLSRLESVWG